VTCWARHPASTDFSGATYTFEKGGITIEGKQGFADVWKRGCFGWEYKGKGKDLKKAYQQLLKYREDLENPPLLVVCDLELFEIHTNFTGTAKQVYRFSLDDLLKSQATADCKLPPIEVLRAVFADPARLRPDRSAADVTEMAAAEFATLADSLRARGVDPQRAAHFLMRLLFCLFAEDITLLPPKLFSKLLENMQRRPADFKVQLAQLFATMASGGAFGTEFIAHFNGDLFTDAEVFDLSLEDLETLLRVSKLDWSAIEPAIFGTLFERSLDPGKRSQLGAHYTSRDDILLLVEPVLMAPLRRRWAAVKAKAEELLEKERAGKAGAKELRHELQSLPARLGWDEAKVRAGELLEKGKARISAPKNLQHSLATLLRRFVDELSHVRVLDPACGSGNFLYVSLKLLLDLWKEVSVFGATHGLAHLLPYQVNPGQLYGIETNVYAHELASVVVWIGYIQWLHDNGFGVPPPPILQRLDNIRHMDAVLAHDAQGKPIEPVWPDVDVIIGNPPYVGGNRVRQDLGDAYVEDIFRVYQGRLAASSDFVCYWFERSREMVEAKKAKRVGLLSTQSIRGGVNRAVLERIKATGSIFMAWRDREWLLDGATVHVAFVGFDDGTESSRTLDGQSVSEINADLTHSVDLTNAVKLRENSGLWAYGSQQKGSFDISGATAAELLASPNPAPYDNTKVVRPSINGKQLLQCKADTWVIDFGEDMPEAKAALYEAPFEYVRRVVYPERRGRKEKRQRTHWWLHARPSPKYRKILRDQARYIATPVVSKHRVFVWLDNGVLVDHAIVVFARVDDYFLGVLQSRIHELWSRRKGTQVRDAESGFRYTPSTTFETFPLPWRPGAEPRDDPRVQAIADVARELVEERDSWLNQPGASAAKVKKRTLTRLYNQRPQWLENYHRALDKAVLAAYGWPEDLSDADILERLLALNRERAGLAV
jgi:type II restriction/modification system DNA methylase subunit YeeA